jgi:hypothetical protein
VVRLNFINLEKLRRSPEIGQPTPKNPLLPSLSFPEKESGKMKKNLIEHFHEHGQMNSSN